MKNKGKGIILVAIMFLSFLTGCSSTLKSNPNTGLNDVDIATSVKTGKNKQGNTVYDVVTTVTNNSDKEIMDVKYRLSFQDKSGNELFSFTFSWNGENKPLLKGEKGTSEVSFQHQEKAEKLAAEIVEVKDSTEMPPLHVPEKGEYLYQALNNEHINNLDKELPVIIEGVIDHMGAQEIAEVLDEETIKELVDEFKLIKIGNETNTFVTDNYNGIRFTFADGSEYYISLNLTTLEIRIYGKEHLYELDNFGPFWNHIKELAEYPTE